LNQKQKIVINEMVKILKEVATESIKQIWGCSDFAKTGEQRTKSSAAKDKHHLA
jgi:hypothetical protein